MTENIFLKYANTGVQQLKPYVSGKPISTLERELGIKNAIKLASNENPLGTSPQVAIQLNQAMKDLNYYPDGSHYDLRHALADKHQISPTSITIGNGSNDILDMIARVFLSQNNATIFSQYAFAVYYLASQSVNAEMNIIPAKDYGHDLNAMLRAISNKTQVIWIANPNNPTGTWLNKQDLYQFIQAVPKNIIVVVDEAYIEYVIADDFPDASLWLSEFKNLIITRTFSKAYGLAALRVGYALSHPDIANLLNRVRQPFNVNHFAQIAAIAALKDQDFVQKSVQFNQQGMQQLTTGFNALGLSYIESVGNFILLDLKQDASLIDLALQQQGIITRPVANYGMPNHLRISIGLNNHHQKLLDTLKKVL